MFSTSAVLAAALNSSAYADAGQQLEPRSIARASAAQVEAEIAKAADVNARDDSGSAPLRWAMNRKRSNFGPSNGNTAYSRCGHPCKKRQRQLTSAHSSAVGQFGGRRMTPCEKMIIDKPKNRVKHSVGHKLCGGAPMAKQNG